MKRIGFVKYINALPFTLPFSFDSLSPQIDCIFGTPQELTSDLREKKLDCALTSATTAFEGDYLHLPEFGIAADQEILSVLFYHRVPLSSLSGARVGLTTESATSIALLKVLCYQMWNVFPCFELFKKEVPLETYDAFLLIGDTALQNPYFRGFNTQDLATAWAKETGLPFVFALFSLQSTISQSERDIFSQTLARALDWSEKNRECVIQEAMKKCPLPKEQLSRYFSTCRYRLTPHYWEGIRLFNHLRTCSKIEMRHV